MDIKITIEADTDASYQKRGPAIELEQQTGTVASPVKITVGEVVTYVRPSELMAAARALYV